MNIGVDFGTTYSTFAQYDKTTGTVSEIDFGEAEKSCVPSIVSYDTVLKKYRFGSAAREQVFMKGERYRFYRAFKMLLPEQDRDMLAARGYTNQTPKEISKLFLGNFLNMARPNNKKFGKMVVCVPEIWNGSNNTLDGRNYIRQICQELDVTKTVQLVTEPEAASAYFVHNYEKKHKQPFSGYVLTVDYGGGTLDITLTKTRNISQNGRSITQLQSLARAGRGENHDREVGAAGIAYMEGVVKLALRDAGFDVTENNSYLELEFLQAVLQCERALLSLDSQREMRQNFGYCEFDYKKIKENLHDEPLESITYDGHDVTITYAHLAEAYENIIYPVLNDGLEQIISLSSAMGEEAVNLLNPDQPILYASVGGFGKFVLVEQQVYKKLGYTAAQQLENQTVLARRESAVALGAALIADNVIDIRPVAAHSLGIYAKRHTQNSSGKFVWQNVVNYAVRYGEPIEPGKKYYVRSQSNPDRLMGYAISNNSLSNFLIGYNTNYNVGCLMPVRDAFLKHLQNLPSGRVAVGFSQNEDGIICVHIHPVDEMNRLVGKNSRDITLSIFNELFDTVEAHVIIDGEETHI